MHVKYFTEEKTSNNFFEDMIRIFSLVDKLRNIYEIAHGRCYRLFQASKKWMIRLELDHEFTLLNLDLGTSN